MGLAIHKDLFDELLDLMSTRKPWKHVSLSSCSGQVPMLLKAILELDCTERLAFGTHYPESRATDFLALTQGLPNTRLLSSLDLGLGVLTPAGAFTLAASISKCTSILRELNLGMLRIEIETNDDNTRSLSTPSRRAFAQAMLGTAEPDDIPLPAAAAIQISACALAKAIVHNSNITKLKLLCHNNPEKSSLQLNVLEELPARPSPLDELKLGWFPPSAIQRTLKIIQSNKLRGLDVSCVRSQDMKRRQADDATEITIDVVSIVKILDTNTSLKRLNISVNNISDDELLEILTKLRHNSTLEELDLSYNKITDQGACRIAEALPQLPGLKRWRLKGNDIGNVGCQSLLANMKGNMQIERLELEPTLKGCCEIALVTQWNRGGRRILKDDHFLLSLWPLVLGRINRIMCVLSDGALPVDGRPEEVLYYFLRQGPVLFQQP
jgi:hypothetical protein